MKKWAYPAKSELIRLKSELIRSKRAYPVAEYTRFDIFRARRISSQLIRRTSVSGEKTSLSGRKVHEMAVGIKNSSELIRRKSELRSSWLDLSCRIGSFRKPWGGGAGPDQKGGVGRTGATSAEQRLPIKDQGSRIKHQGSWTLFWHEWAFSKGYGRDIKTVQIKKSISYQFL